jgi:hypothetical protein
MNAPRALEPVTGESQIGTPGFVLAQPVAVRLVDATGNPVPGATVTWIAEDREAVVTPLGDLTDADGIARATWRLGRDDGTQHVRATFGALESVRFAALAASGNLAQAGGTVAHQCGAFVDEIVRCWQPPNGDPGRAIALDTDLRFTALGFAIDRWCGATRGGSIACFLEADLTPGGQFRPDAAPVTVVASGLPIFTKLVGAGDPEVGITWCALSVTQQAWCWGENGSGQLGRGVIGPASTVPLPVDGELRAIAIAVTAGAACALDQVGAPWCWGAATDGVVPGGVPSPVPVPIATPRRFFGLAADATGSVCGVEGSGIVSCWGSNRHGGRGRNGIGVSSEPVPIEGTDPFVAIVSAGDGFLGITLDRFVVVWGGLEAADVEARPVRVLLGHVYGEAFAGGGRGALCIRAYPDGTRCVDRVGLARELLGAQPAPVIWGVPGG